MVVTQDEIGSRVGFEVIRAGGNAIDAAVTPPGTLIEPVVVRLSALVTVRPLKAEIVLLALVSVSVPTVPDSVETVAIVPDCVTWPVASSSMRNAAGREGRPGIVRISPAKA